MNDGSSFQALHERLESRRLVPKALRFCLASIQYALASRYWRNPTTRLDLKRAAYWAEKAAQNGRVEANLIAANVLLTYPQDARDYQRAVALSEAAANAGLAAAQQQLAWCYEQGVGVQVDAAIAVMWYERAAANGWRDAQLHLANVFNDGHLVPRDLKKARLYYEMAATSGAEPSVLQALRHRIDQP